MENFIALHGFLGHHSDWSQAFEPDISYVAVNLWADARAISERLDGSVDGALNAWALEFTNRVRETGDGEKPILLGYSMGARLAMHALLTAPELFAGGVLVSGHPGLSSAAECEARCENDRKWAERFRSQEAWAELLADWNAQPVLQPAISDASRLERREEFFDREVLAYALEAWSLGRQVDLRQKLATMKVPLLHIAGREDRKFASFLLEPFANRHGHYTLRGAGHRVPWDAPVAFRELLRRYGDWIQPRS